MNPIFTFIICLLTSFILPTVLGVSYKAYEQDWYKNLKRPSFAFPDIVFIVIFPVFYILEAIGLFYIVTYDNKNSIWNFVILYLLSAILSGIWSRLFFKYKRCDLSLWVFFFELPVGWIFLFLLYQENHFAWAFFLPRVIWGFYAIFANVEYFRLNREFWENAKAKR
ncbi:MAG: tryptophan-rich sensory protein [Saprospiraceae bacterium]|nr:tryptophan-rich sensory protein [Saprospiraceae bacterium]